MTSGTKRKRRTSLTEEQKRFVRREYSDGKTGRQLAQENNVDISTIHSALHEVGLTARDRNIGVRRKPKAAERVARCIDPATAYLATRRNGQPRYAPLRLPPLLVKV